VVNETVCALDRYWKVLGTGGKESPPRREHDSHASLKVLEFYFMTTVGTPSEGCAADIPCYFCGDKQNFFVTKVLFIFTE